jgi:uncharacterized membrane protein YGL010W
MNLTRKWFLAMCICAFAAAMLLFNTNSYHADKNNLNTHYLVVGIVLALAAVVCLLKVMKYGRASKEDEKW